MIMKLRPIEASDQPFLDEMLYQALYIPEDQKPPRSEIFAQPHLMKYCADWGRDHDTGLLAESDDAPLGAAWFRLFPEDQPGYGFVDASTPELTVALLPTHRGLGIGTRLLEGLLEAARGHYPKLSLSVSRENPAMRWYLRFGFEVVGEEGGSWVMVKSL